MKRLVRVIASYHQPRMLPDNLSLALCNPDLFQISPCLIFSTLFNLFSASRSSCDENTSRDGIVRSTIGRRETFLEIADNSD